MSSEGPENGEHLESYVDESDDEGLTAEQMLQALENAWLNEKFAPELLPHNAELVEIGLKQISYMEENLKQISRDDIRKNIHTMEVCRIRFVISSYLRKRLEKIEEFAVYLLEEEEKNPEESAMTPEESQFAKEYITHLQSLFKTVTLQHLPNRIGQLNLSDVASVPNMDKHVFVRANKDINGIMIGDSEEADYEEGSQHIVKYSAIAPFVKSGDIQLI